MWPEPLSQSSDLGRESVQPTLCSTPGRRVYRRVKKCAPPAQRISSEAQPLGEFRRILAEASPFGHRVRFPDPHTIDPFNRTSQQPRTSGAGLFLNMGARGWVARHRR